MTIHGILDAETQGDTTPVSYTHLADGLSSRFLYNFIISYFVQTLSPLLNRLRFLQPKGLRGVLVRIYTGLQTHAVAATARAAYTQKPLIRLL